MRHVHDVCDRQGGEGQILMCFVHTVSGNTHIAEKFNEDVSRGGRED